MSQYQLLVIDDDRWLLESMADWLRSEGYVVHTAETIAQAKKKVSELTALDLVLCDVRIQDADGMDFLRWIHRKAPQTPVLMMSGYTGPNEAAEAVAAGAIDLLTKPLIDQELTVAMQRAIEQNRISQENEQLKAQLDRRFGMENILSHDLRMSRIFDVIDCVADARATVLITGENGTGKSLIARAIHQRSRRRTRPFIEVACGALPDNLLESELFGHVSGAFTGATTNKIGKFKLADSGSLFLDEIGTASPALQVKLLRALQELQFEPLGGTETITVDTRVVLATNENLELAVHEGRFRQDLFYRINVIRIELPALRERRDDIPLLVDHFLQIAAKEYGREIDGFSPSAMNVLYEHAWPGNIRELENVVQRAVLLTKKPTIDPEMLPPSMLRGQHTSLTSSAPIYQGSTPFLNAGTPESQTLSSQSNGLSNSSPINGNLQSSSLGATHPVPSRMEANSTVIASTSTFDSSRPMTLDEALEEPERRIILEVLRLRNWNRSETAAQLGINRTTLYKKMKKLGLESVEAGA